MLLAMRPLIPPQPPPTHTPYAYLFPRSTCTHTHITPITPCLQSLILVDEPWYNEPGYEQRADLAASDRYSAGLLPATVKWAMLDQLQHPPDYFADVIRQHFRWVCGGGGVGDPAAGSGGGEGGRVWWGSCAAPRAERSPDPQAAVLHSLTGFGPRLPRPPAASTPTANCLPACPFAC